MTTSHPLPPDERLKLDNQLCFATSARCWTICRSILRSGPNDGLTFG